MVKVVVVKLSDGSVLSGLNEGGSSVHRHSGIHLKAPQEAGDVPVAACPARDRAATCQAYDVSIYLSLQYSFTIIGLCSYPCWKAVLRRMCWVNGDKRFLYVFLVLLFLNTLLSSLSRLLLPLLFVSMGLTYHQACHRFF